MHLNHFTKLHFDLILYDKNVLIFYLFILLKWRHSVKTREFKNFMLIMNQNMPFLILIPLKMLLNFKVLLMHLRDPCPNRPRTLKWIRLPALYRKCLTLFGQTSSWDYINFNNLIIVMNFETCSRHHGSRKNESATFKTIK